MNETNGCIAVIFTALLLVCLFLLAANISTAKRLDDFMQEQRELNEITYQQDEAQDKEIRILMQDAEINRNILTSKEFLKR